MSQVPFLLLKDGSSAPVLLRTQMGAHPVDLMLLCLHLVLSRVLSLPMRSPQIPSSLSEVQLCAPEVCAASAGSEMATGPSICAVLLQDASFAWGARDSSDGEHADEAKRAAEARHQPSSSTMHGWALAQSSVVLRELTLAIPQRSLTAIVGDIGSGEHP